MIKPLLIALLCAVPARRALADDDSFQQLERLAGASAGGLESAKKRMLLTAKADLLERRTRRDHRPWLGLVFNIDDDADGKFKEYSDLGDSAIWTGHYVAAEALRYEATGDTEALTAMEESLRGLHALHEATGVPGLIARVLIPEEYAREHGIKAEGTLHRGVGKYKDWLWQGDLSNDQYTGYLFGVAAAFPDIQDAALRAAVRADLLAIGLHVIAHDMRIVSSVDGTFLDFRDNYYYQDRWPKALRGLPMPPWRSENSVQGLHLMRVCATFTQDPRLLAYYRDEMILKREMDLRLLDSPTEDGVLRAGQGALSALASAYAGQYIQARPEIMRSGIELNLTHIALYDLARLETDPGLRETYRKALAREHARIAGEKNSYWNFLAASQNRDERAVADGVSTLDDFPTKPIFGRSDNSSDPSVPKIRNLAGDAGLPAPRMAAKPLPIGKQALDAAFPWQGNPYQLDGGPDRTQGSGVGFLTAYWLGRRYGFISGDQ